MEFKIIKKEIGVIEFNYEEVKADLQIQLKQFEGMIVSEDAIVEAKKTRAGLNNIAKMIDDRRKEVKKEFLKPYEVVEKQAKDLISIIGEVNGAIDAQLKAFEEKEKEAKKEQVIALWEAKDYQKVGLEQIWNDKWLNKTVTLKQVEKEIDEKITNIESDLNSIKVLVVDNNEKVLALQSKYLVSLDLQRVLYDYQQEEERKKYLENINQNVVKDEPVVDSVNIPDKEDTQVEEEKLVYLLQFEVVGTEDEIKKLSEFLKTNNYNYRKL